MRTCVIETAYSRIALEGAAGEGKSPVTVARYHKIARQYDAEIWYGHDQKQWATIKKSTEGYYD